MNILAHMIVSNSDITKNYKICREKAECYGKAFILKNNVPDAVLFSITSYERLSGLIEFAEYLDDKQIENIRQLMSAEKVKQAFSKGLLTTELEQAVVTDIIA